MGSSGTPSKECLPSILMESDFRRCCFNARFCGNTFRVSILNASNTSRFIEPPDTGDAWQLYACSSMLLILNVTKPFLNSYVVQKGFNLKISALKIKPFLKNFARSFIRKPV
jgi:hypothetical protein